MSEHSYRVGDPLRQPFPLQSFVNCPQVKSPIMASSSLSQSLPSVFVFRLFLLPYISTYTFQSCLLQEGSLMLPTSSVSLLGFLHTGLHLLGRGKLPGFQDQTHLDGNPALIADQLCDLEHLNLLSYSFLSVPGEYLPPLAYQEPYLRRPGYVHNILHLMVRRL